MRATTNAIILSKKMGHTLFAQVWRYVLTIGRPEDTVGRFTEYVSMLINILYNLLKILANK